MTFESRVRQAFLAAVLLGAAPALAGEFKEPTRVLDGFKTSDLLLVGAELGFVAEAGRWPDGMAYVRFTTANGVFTATPVVCDDAKCYGLDIIASFGRETAASLEAVNFYNRRSFSKAFSLDGQLYLTRYEIADFGIPRGNLGSSLQNFDLLAADFAAFLESGGREASSQSPIMTDPVAVITTTGKTSMGLSPERLRTRGPQPRYHQPTKP